MASPAATISAIDKQIDANRRALLARTPVKNKLSARDWQAAWDRHPELQSCERELFYRRGVAQEERSAIAAKQARRLTNYAKPKKCPTCGGAFYGKAVSA